MGFWELALATMVLGGFFWFFAIVGVEPRVPAATVAGRARTKAREQFAIFRSTFGRIWQDRRARMFMLFLALAMMSAWAQEAILEPFGAEVLRQDIRQTTRYAAYWQGPTALILIAAGIYWRKRRPETQIPIAQVGLAIMALGMAALALTSLLQSPGLMLGVLVVFGVGFGLFTFSAFQLLVVMTSEREAGAYLGLWAVTVLLARGVGISLGGALRDGLIALTASPPLSYGLIYAFEAAGLAAAIVVLARVNVLSFARDTGRAARSSDARVIGAEV
jgi:BCD family chlorophyll transporter-like MFS transporter